MVPDAPTRSTMKADMTSDTLKSAIVHGRTARDANRCGLRGKAFTWWRHRVTCDACRNILEANLRISIHWSPVHEDISP